MTIVPQKKHQIHGSTDPLPNSDTGVPSCRKSQFGSRTGLQCLWKKIDGRGNRVLAFQSFSFVSYRNTSASIVSYEGVLRVQTREQDASRGSTHRAARIMFGEQHPA